MAYLTYDEYKGFGFTEIDQAEFDKLLPKASDAIDSISRYFYKFHDLETDIPLRKELFKKAVAAQIEYFHETGSTTSYGMNEPSNVTIGRTYMSSGSRNSQESPQNDLISKEVVLYLKDTGLLYKGIRVV